MPAPKVAKPYEGELVVNGFIRLDQFWPNRQLGRSLGSDADTVVAGLELDGITFRPKPGDQPRKTTVFERARIRSSNKKDAPVLKGGNPDSKTPADPPRVTVRLQWIDAPELHYPVIMPGVKTEGIEWRQPLGESAVWALFRLLQGKANGSPTLPVTLRTRVDHPSDVFDTYGRFIGDVEVHFPDGSTVNVNQWIAENGWAYPTYYDTIIADEKTTIDGLVQKARAAGRGIWAHDVTTSAKKLPLSSKVTFEKGDGDFTAAEQKADVGDVYLPKLFRRMAQLFLKKKQGLTKAKTLGEYVRKDRFIDAASFLAGQTKSKSLSTAFGADGSFRESPGDLVFTEKTSKLVDDKGKEITNWW